MEIWHATIKEVNNESLLETTYTFADDMFGHIKDEKQKYYEKRKFLIDFWGLNNKDVEWFLLEKL